jgi:Prenyltransferase and squalene oxidase repeat
VKNSVGARAREDFDSGLADSGMNGAVPSRANSSDDRPSDAAGYFAKALVEATGLLRAPQRIFPLMRAVVSDKLRVTFSRPHLYSYTKTRLSSDAALNSVLDWVLRAQRADGGVAAYYSLFTGYSQSYPEVTGYLIPTLYDFAAEMHDGTAQASAERATHWLLSLQMPCGAFPAGLHGRSQEPSVFNTGQILQGLVRAYRETRDKGILRSAISAGDWLIEVQQSDGSWAGPGAYQNSAHTYYTMVAWALAELAEIAGDRSAAYGAAAERNLDWALSHFQGDGWVDGINLRGHPNYLHFIAYVLQGALECGCLRRRDQAIDAVAKPAWILLRKFETHKVIAGAFHAEFKTSHGFTCLTGNAQMSCVWLRLYELTGDLRYLNAALKMNEMLKDLLPQRGGQGIRGGVSGSYPIWGRYQPLRYISWGCKFLTDALLLERRIVNSFEVGESEALSCAS